ncbi:PREDICTED: NADH dehydrogenase [ubiquinone] 1 alpha subcomplex subunit 2 [Gekko japonicus]|uniref:NADH dehydrogenase [ubiquinone] 1 alpha subcomplex subunit 2 n=1 Tax=Gekko japonicus TaxID=146911 RepID=A0ABM1KVR4_GEKJA|nr:PREDICTED: NADH dehydrogenase [ubiquinone] 1 alpha subcomplex subunit 2 [Gekko japonicus]
MAAGSAARVIGSHLKEIRIHLCQRSPGSQGVRDFIEKQYVPLKKANPDFPVLIRECSDVQPKLWARYDEAPLTSRFLRLLWCSRRCGAREKAGPGWHTGREARPKGELCFKSPADLLNLSSPRADLVPLH